MYIFKIALVISENVRIALLYVLRIPAVEKKEDYNAIIVTV